jgi:hypothetical protein
VYHSDPQIILLANGGRTWEECGPKTSRTETHQEPVGKPYEKRVTVTGPDVKGPMCQKFQNYQPQTRTATDYDVLTYAAQKHSSLGWNIAIGVGIGLLVVGAIFVTGGLAVGAGAAFLGASGGATGAAVAGGGGAIAIGGGAMSVGQLGKPSGDNLGDYDRGALLSTTPATDYTPWQNAGAIYEQSLGPPYPCP